MIKNQFQTCGRFFWHSVYFVNRLKSCLLMFILLNFYMNSNEIFLPYCAKADDLDLWPLQS